MVQKVTPPHPPTTGIVADRSLWVVSYSGGVVMELDADTGQFVRTLPAPFHAPVGIAATDHDLWVVNHDDSTLTRIDARTGTVTGTTQLPGKDAGGPLVAGGSIWIRLAGDNAVARVNPFTGQVVGEPLDLSPTGTCGAGSVIHNEVWFTSGRGEGFPCRDGARRIDAATSTVTAPVNGPGKHVHTFAGLGGDIWASDRGHTLYRVNADTGALHNSLTLDPPDDDNRLITAFGSIWVLRPNTGRVVRVNAT